MSFISQKLPSHNFAVVLFVAIQFIILGVEITTNLQGVKNHILKVVTEMGVNQLRIELKMEFRPTQETTSR